jgi:NAD-dependent deacetylase
MNNNIVKAVEWIKSSRYFVAFTGAGISVESGIPPFRGEKGLWSKYDPIFLDIWYFHKNPEKSWLKIKEIFYDFFGKSKPNPAHYALAELESEGYLKSIITQNIDNLHQEGGSKTIIEFHGNSRTLVCTKCGKSFDSIEKLIKTIPPQCNRCKGILKPDFIFFSEPIKPEIYDSAINESEKADLYLIIGTTGEIMPASQIPYIAKNNGAKIMEINIEKSRYTDSITDLFLQGKASVIMEKILTEIKKTRD